MFADGRNQHRPIPVTFKKPHLFELLHVSNASRFYRFHVVNATGYVYLKLHELFESKDKLVVFKINLLSLDVLAVLFFTTYHVYLFLCLVVYFHHNMSAVFDELPSLPPLLGAILATGIPEFDVDCVLVFVIFVIEDTVEGVAVVDVFSCPIINFFYFFLCFLFSTLVFLLLI